MGDVGAVVGTEHSNSLSNRDLVQAMGRTWAERAGRFLAEELSHLGTTTGSPALGSRTPTHVPDFTRLHGRAATLAPLLQVRTALPGF